MPGVHMCSGIENTSVATTFGQRAGQVATIVDLKLI